jgi:polysaccharide biosynthesis transport protein
VSKNFNLLLQAGKDLTRSQTWEPVVVPDVAPSDQSLSQAGRHVQPFTEELAFDWLKAIKSVKNHWKISALFSFVIVLIFALVTYRTQPVYEAQAKVEIDPPGEVFSLDTLPTPSSDRELLQTQAEVLQSDSLAVAVIRELRLDQNQDLVSRTKPKVSELARASRRDALQLTPRESIALEQFKLDLTVKRDTTSRLILVSFLSHDPQLAADVSNTLVQAFIDQSFEMRHDAIEKSTEWLSHQLDDVRNKMEMTSQALAQFQQSAGIVDADDNRNTFSEHMGELTHQLTQAEAERIQLEALLKSVQAGNPESLPEVRSNPVVQQLSQKLAEQRVELSQLLVVYGKNHPAVKKLQSQIDELQNQLNQQESATVNSLKASYSAAGAREHMMAEEMKGTSKELDQMARYSALKKEVQTNVDLYNSLYAKIKEAGISAASKSANIHIIDPARVPRTPVRPRWIRDMCAGVLVAVLGGVILAVILEMSGDKLRSPADFKRWIGTSSVCVIPAFDQNDRVSPRLVVPKRSSALPPGPGIASEVRNDMFLLERPNSPAAEALHGLYGSLTLGSRGDPPQVVLITSAFPGEGKTTIALNLSLAFAKHAKTCILDADLRRGRIAKAFGLSAMEGLRDLLTDPQSVEGVLREVPGRPNLSIVSTGSSRENSDNSGQILCSDRMRRVLQELRGRFRFVVIDSAPLLPFVDGRALSAMADAVVLVGRAGSTTRAATQRCMELLAEIPGTPALHVVLNGAHIGTTEYKYYGYGTY